MLHGGREGVKRFCHSKTVIKEGEPKKAVNSAPLTIAKDELRKLLKTNKYTQFALEMGNTLKLNGETLEL